MNKKARRVDILAISAGASLMMVPSSLSSSPTHPSPTSLFPQLAKIMDQFEKQFEDTDVRTGYLEGAIASTTASATPQEMVDSLIQETADAHNLELGTMLDDAGMVGNKLPAVEAPAANDLEQRFAALRK